MKKFQNTFFRSSLSEF